MLKLNNNKLRSISVFPVFTLLLLLITSFSVSANISGIKQALNIDDSPITALETGQSFKYRLVWQCSFTNVPPVNGCGDFLLTDILPQGTEFVSCSVNGDYTCNEAGGTVTIDKVGGTNGVNLGDGDSSEAIITVRLSTDPNDYPGGVIPTEIENTAQITSGLPPLDPSTTVPINAPTDNWEIGKSATVPELPLNPALDNNVSYEIEICPNGPAGVGTGTTLLENAVITDACDANATFISATFDGNPISPQAAPNNACPSLQFALPSPIDPADGCRQLEITLQYPSANFNVGDNVTNIATGESDSGSIEVCTGSCGNVVEQTIAAPTPGANLSKSSYRDQSGVGARNEYYITFNTTNSNVVQNNVVIEDIFPTEIIADSVSLRGWSDSSVEANLIELPSNTVLETNYNGSPLINRPLNPSATGVRLVFTTPVPPGFAGGRMDIFFETKTTLTVPSSFENCATLNSTQLTTVQEACRTIQVVPDQADVSIYKTMPNSLNPGEEFNVRFDFLQSYTSSAGVENPTVIDCLPAELEFVSWDSFTFTGGLDDPRNPINTTNLSPLGKLPNFQLLAPGAAGNNCPAGAQLRWSWKAVAPAGSLQLDRSPGVANPFTFPARPDTNGDNISDSNDAYNGITVRFAIDATLKVKSATPAQNGLLNTVGLFPESENFRCNAPRTDAIDVDGDGNTSETFCYNAKGFSVNSTSAFGASKFIGGFAGMPNIDPDNPPTNANASSATTPAFCPEDPDGRTRAPCIAQAQADQPFDYRVRLSNDGNIPITDYIAYDIFPYAGDVGVTEAQAGATRGSTWTPELLGPIVVYSANATVQAELQNNAVIEYSASSNPCRPELSIANDSNWQTTCVDDWTDSPLSDSTTFPNGYASVRAWRLKVPFASGWPLANQADLLEEDIVVDMQMLAQESAPRSDYDNNDMQIAWNNIAHRASNQVNGLRLLASEARKSGIAMPADGTVSSTGLRIGNLVWSDNDNDGVAEDGEPGLYDVTVQLWRDADSDGQPSAGDVLYDTQQTDAFGHYLFDDSNPRGTDGVLGTADDVRDNLGIPAGDYYVVIPSAQQGSFVLDDNFSSTGAGNNVNANDDLDNDDNGAADNRNSAVTTSDAGSPDIEGIYSGAVTLAVGTEPTNEQLRSDDVTDDDNDFFTDNDSNVSVDFGFYQLRIGNHVWLDEGAGANRNNGVADSDEFALQNMQVELWLDSTDDDAFNPTNDTRVGQVSTDAQGQFLFDGLDEGDYFIAIPSGQAGLISNGTNYSTSSIVASGVTSTTVLTDDNRNDGSSGEFGGTTYASVSSLYRLAVNAAQTAESDTSSNGINGASSTDPADANVELAVNIANNQYFYDGNSFLTADFSFVRSVSLGSTIWEDADADGIQEAGENPIVGATVTLLNADGSEYDSNPALAGVQSITTTTDADGQYNFNNLIPGTYRVSVDLSTVATGGDLLASLVQQSNANNNANNDSNVDLTNAVDSDLDDQLHYSAPIQLSAGDEPTNETDPIGTGPSDQPNQALTTTDTPDSSGNMTLDMGFYRPVSLGSKVWIDNDQSGTQTAADTPVIGATVTLLNADGSVYDSDPNTPAIEPLTDTTDSNGFYNFNDLAPGDYRVQVNLVGATNTNALNLTPTPAQVADPDAAGPGQDNNLDSNIDASADSDLSDQTHVSGVVTLSVGGEPTNEQDPIGALADQPNQGLTAAEQPDANGNMTVDFGFIEPVSLGSTIWFDADSDGLQDAGESGIEGVTVTLLNADGTVYDSNPSVAGIQSLTTTTDADGQYNFNGLPEGSYRVQANLGTATSTTGGVLKASPSQVANPNNNANDDSNVDVNAPGHNPSANTFQSGVVILSIDDEPSGETDPIGNGGSDQPNQIASGDSNGNMTVDMGFYAPVSLGSTIWEDTNGDGVQDANDLPIQNATVTLLNADGSVFDSDPTTAGNQILQVTTDADGQYNFDGLPPGDYRVRVDLSTVAGGSSLFPTPTQVADPDAAGDNNTDSNVDVPFDANSSDQVHFSGVVTLTVGGEPTNEQDPIGTSTPADQPNQGLSSTDDPDSSGNMTVDMGFVKPVSLGSTVWLDSNSNGLQDDQEVGVAGATVTLLDAAGNPVTGVASVVTDANGQYNFNDLAPGDYRVQVDLSTATGGASTLIPSPVQEANANNNANNDSNIDVPFDTNTSDQTHISSLITLSSGDEPTSETDLIDGVDGNAAVVDQPNQTADNPDNSGNMTVDMGFYAPLSIGSLVWEDSNADGIQDSSEPPIAGAQVSLLFETAPGVFSPARDVNNDLIAPVTTGANGLYQFTNLPVGVYRVQVTPPANLYPTPVQTVTNDDDSETDSNIARETAPGSNVFESGDFTLLAGLEPNESGPDANRGDSQDGAPGSITDLSGNHTVDFGFVLPAAIGNYVWLDLDMDGVQDANENGIAGVEVTLTPPANIDAGNGIGVPVTVTTGPNGEYLFPDLPPFTSSDPTEGYVVTVDPTTLPSGLQQTYDEGTTPGSLGTLDHQSAPIQLDPKEEHLTADFGYAPPSGSVGDTIWVDANDDGVQNPGEPGIGGVTVSITPAPGVDLGAGPGNPITTVTDSNGRYLFPNLPLDNTYVVEVDISTLPAGYTSSASGLGDPDVRDGNSSVADNQTTVVITPDNPVNLDLDFGYLPAPDQNNSIGDTIWLDVDKDGEGPTGANTGADPTEQGISGVTVSLTNIDTNTVVATTITDANGQYLFTGLPDGNYRVTVTDQNNVLDGLEQTYDNDDGVSSSPSTPNVSIVDLDSAGASSVPVENLDQDFGYVSPDSTGGEGSIGDTVFFDQNGSGTPDAGEGIEGATVSLYGPGPDGVFGTPDDVLLATDTTDENGNYLFTGLDTSASGTPYRVIVDTSTLPNGGAGWSNSVDPDGGNNSYSDVSLTDANPIDLDQDFGYVGTDNNSLSGTVWIDNNGDGQQDESEYFKGVTIELRDSSGNVVATTRTDAEGNYQFDNLPDGEYRVIVTDEDNVLDGFQHTDSPNGNGDTSDATSKDDTGYVVDLDSSGTNPNPVDDTTGDFGYEPIVTTPISLGFFKASSKGVADIEFSWATQTEVANLGFYIYARVNDEWVRLNQDLVLGKGDSVSIQRYSFNASIDASIFALSDIDVTGKETLHGPFALDKEYGQIAERKAIDWGDEKSERDRKQQLREQQRKQQQLERNKLRQLQLLNNQSSNSVKSNMHLNNNIENSFFNGLVNKSIAAFVSLIIPAAHAQELQSEELINLHTKSAGIYEVKVSQLANEGGVNIDGVDIERLALTNKGQPVAISVLSDSNIVDANTKIRFLAEELDTLYSDTNVYTLSLDVSKALRISVDNRAASGQAANSYLRKQKVAKQAKYSFTSPDTNDPWYSDRIVAINKPTSKVIKVKLEDVAPGGNTGATKSKLRLNAWGATNLPGSEMDHSLGVKFNGVPIAAKKFDGLTEAEVASELSKVNEGYNYVTLDLPLDTGYAYDAINLNEVEVSYPSQFVAKQGKLNFTSNFAKFRIRGFLPEQLPNNEEDLLVFARSDGSVTQMTNNMSSCQAQRCMVQVAGLGKTAEYFVTSTTEGALPSPEFVSLPVTKDIKSNEAKYLIISHPDFIAENGDSLLENLAIQLASEFGSADIVDVENIYAQFGNHVFDPTAIKDYIKYSYNNRGTRYVLLVGGDVYDYRKFENQDATSFIPSLYGQTGNNITFAPIDSKYADVDDDNVQDIAIGRLPVRTVSQLRLLIQKRTDYLNRTYSGKALFVADKYDQVQRYSFSSDANQIEENYMANFAVEKAYVDELGVSSARQKVRKEIEQGITLTAFFGHSSTNQWSFDGLFTGPDAAQLNNVGKPTVVTQWGCWNAYYVSPNEDSMGHRFMMEGDRGAVAVMGASTLTEADNERKLASMVFEQLSKGLRLGDAVIKAKKQYVRDNGYHLDVVLGWTILGFPEIYVN